MVYRMHLAVFTAVFLLAVSGCKTTGEKKAWQDIGDTEYGYVSSGPAGGTGCVLDENSGLKDYIKYAALNNPGLRADFYKWKAALLKVPVVSSLPDPMISYTRYVEEVETRVGPQENGYSITQKIPLPDKLSIRARKAFDAAEAERARYEAAKLKLFYEVTEAYCEYAYLEKAVVLVRENIKLLEYFEKVAEVKFKTGITKSQDLLKVQVELGKLSNDLTTLEDLEGPLRARLNASLNRPFDTPIAEVNEITPDFSGDAAYKDINCLVSVLVEQNPELKGLGHKIAESEENLQLAKREYFPDLTVGAGIIDTGQAQAPVTGSGKDAVMIKFAFNMPIWFSKLRAEVKEAEAGVYASTDTRENKENLLLARLKMAHYRYQDAQRQVQLYQDALIPKAEQSLKTDESGYQGDIVDFLTLIDSQRILLSFELAYHRAVADYHEKLAEIKMLIGGEEAL